MERGSEQGVYLNNDLFMVEREALNRARVYYLFDDPIRFTEWVESHGRPVSKQTERNLSIWRIFSPKWLYSCLAQSK